MRPPGFRLVGDERQEEGTLKNWDLKALDLKPRLPEILSSSEAARVIALDLKPGEGLDEHEVHERAWVIVIGGEIEASTVSGGSIKGGPGTLIEFAPGERHQLASTMQSRVLLMLAPWPGEGHPGGMSIRDKLYARRRAAKQKR